MAAKKTDLEVVVEYVKQAIATDFPMIAIAEIVGEPELSENNELAGVFRDDAGRTYSFYIDKADSRPVLQRV